MDLFDRLAEERIREAQARGEFDHLPGAGAPLDLEDWSRVPAESRMAYQVLKRAGYLPPELEARREALALVGRLEGLDAPQRERGLKRLALLNIQLTDAGLSPVTIADAAGYGERVLAKLGREPHR
ncbi:DUF1992 domain-containing protein [Crenobacter sp. SG2305]|uniref:DnaJ family domain-containing protein n=1 Tax=Crenobacter oryzisoli TaxID=3056844 RepID=UPI0025AAC1A2|nr:DnaJ family domain-containing protein [Crenobacter sp. SG2305]MDN0084161.1 DUF1992 domain-containing protein [Crenobacter sp. SG2305]